MCNTATSFTFETLLWQQSKFCVFKDETFLNQLHSSSLTVEWRRLSKNFLSRLIPSLQHSQLNSDRRQYIICKGELSALISVPVVTKVQVYATKQHIRPQRQVSLITTWWFSCRSGQEVRVAAVTLNHHHLSLGPSEWNTERTFLWGHRSSLLLILTLHKKFLGQYQRRQSDAPCFNYIIHYIHRVLPSNTNKISELNRKHKERIVDVWFSELRWDCGTWRLHRDPSGSKQSFRWSENVPRRIWYLRIGGRNFLDWILKRSSSILQEELHVTEEPVWMLQFYLWKWFSETGEESRSEQRLWLQSAWGHEMLLVEPSTGLQRSCACTCMSMYKETLRRCRRRPNMSEPSMSTWQVDVEPERFVPFVSNFTFRTFHIFCRFSVDSVRTNPEGSSAPAWSHLKRLDSSKATFQYSVWILFTKFKALPRSIITSTAWERWFLGPVHQNWQSDEEFCLSWNKQPPEPTSLYFPATLKFCP